MAPIQTLSVLAFASAVLAVPHAQRGPLFKRHAHPVAPAAYDPPAYDPPATETSSAAPEPSIPVYDTSSADPASSIPAYGSSSYGSSSSAYPASSIPAYGSSSYSWSSSGYAASSIPVYGSSSSAYPVSSSYGIPSYGASSSAAPASSVPTYPSGGYPSTSICTETTTKIYRSTTEYSTYYVTHTIYATKPTTQAYPVTYGSSPADTGYETDPATAPPTYEDPATCVPDVTITTTEKTTVYVTLEASSAAPVPAYTVPDKVYSDPAPAPSYPAETTPAPAPSYPAESTPAPEPSTPSIPSTPAPYSGKRGLAYNDASLCNAFAGSNAAGWAYNWGSDSAGLDPSIPFIPTLWGPASQFSSNWAEKAKTAIEGGAQYLFGFNEPDMSNQANLSPQAAAEAWKTYMEPFAGQAKLVAPSVTNGQDPNMGLGWLQQFLDACSGCTIDAYAQHWYFPTNDAQNFKDQLTKTAALGGGKPVWLSEFGAIGSDAEKSEFLKEVLPWLDSNDSILGYSYFMVADGMLNSGSGLSGYGETYANA